MVKVDNKIYYTLRIATAMCFIGHGVFGIITKAVWCNYFAVFGIGHNMAYELMPLLGAIDILMGISLLVYPTRVILLWLVIWGTVTASLRPLSGEPFAEFIERAGNYGAPLCLLILCGIKNKSIKEWFAKIKPDIVTDEKSIAIATTCLQIVVVILLAGHGWLNIIGKKSLVTQYSALGFSNPLQVAHIAGIFEFAAAFSILIRPIRLLLIILLVWKISTELFYPHWELFEWIERGGSYGTMLALYFVLPSKPFRAQLPLAFGVFFYIIAVIAIGYNIGPFAAKNIAGTDTVAYNYKTFKQRDNGCGNNPDSACTIVKVAYPYFDNKKALNDSIAQKFIKLFALTNAKPDSDYKQFADNFIAGYKGFKQANPKSTLIYLLEGKAKVLRQDSAILTIEVKGYSYHGGPHGVEYTSYVNWNTKTNKAISLKDILVDHYQDSLNKVGEQIFRKNEKLSAIATLNDQRNYFFENNKFKLPNNCLLTPFGIRFLYNVYTIKAYAAGPTKLFIPYTQIQSLLLSGTVVKQYLDND